MPVSKVRKKKNTNRVRQVQAVDPVAQDVPNPPWFPWVLGGLLILGLLWILVFYATAGTIGLPIPGIGNWNLAIGFLFIIAGFAMATKWK